MSVQTVVNISEQFVKLITETRMAGHTMYYVSKKGKWCLRFNYMCTEDGKTVAFFGNSPDDVMKEAVEFIKKNRVMDEERGCRPYIMK